MVRIKIELIGQHQATVASSEERLREEHRPRPPLVEVMVLHVVDAHTRLRAIAELILDGLEHI